MGDLQCEDICERKCNITSLEFKVIIPKNLKTTSIPVDCGWADYFGHPPGFVR